MTPLKQSKREGSKTFVPLTARDQMVKELQKQYPSLTEEQLTLMGG